MFYRNKDIVKLESSTFNLAEKIKRSYLTNMDKNTCDVKLL